MVVVGPRGTFLRCYMHTTPATIDYIQLHTPFHEENPLVKTSQLVTRGTGLGELLHGLVQCSESLLIVSILIDFYLQYVQPASSRQTSKGNNATGIEGCPWS